ncbi:redox-sensitive transcriptional activator SoxR [Alteromonas facilis]|uniref:redox-sensitive transcriptional activator SoxR n=1 Tax=Alteromonas facilis TaxID=2048004 RepID=UPI000C28C461|nr:redox-sensitive transcriptional activator SoxR [Alteromonas facilis]
MAGQALSVGAVAKRCGVAVSTLHFYEQKGLISSQRNTGNQRRYKPDVLRRVSVIKAAQTLGITLQEIKQVFAALPNERTPSKQDWADISATWHVMLNQRIKALESLRDSLSSCIGCGCLSLNSCPLYNPNDELAVKGPGPVILNDREGK